MYGETIDKLVIKGLPTWAFRAFGDLAREGDWCNFHLQYHVWFVSYNNLDVSQVNTCVCVCVCVCV